MMTKKTAGIITFHAAHNYGSVLQAYALQHTVEELGVNCEIINFRTAAQKDQYTPLTKRKGLKYLLKNAYFLFHYKSRKQKFDKFEAFIAEKQKKSKKEYGCLEDLMLEPPCYDYYISGSDQIWNPIPNDANDAYFLPFVKQGKRIAYAPSFGPFDQECSVAEKAEYLKQYDVLSARECFGSEAVRQATGKPVPLMPDPTLLLPAKEWEQMVPPAIVEGNYMFFYTLFATPEMIHLVKQLSNLLQLPVVISNVSNQYEIFSGFRKLKAAGPLDFLSLIYHAKFVCVTSFHGTVFSVMFQKPFFAIDAQGDNRLELLLRETGLEERAITVQDLSAKVKTAYEIDFSQAREAIEALRQQGKAFLASAMELE